MRTPVLVRHVLMCGGLATTIVSSRAFAQSAHDFDFEIGSWKVRNARLLQPLSGSGTWIRFDGTSVAHKAWNGRAVVLELESDPPSGHSEGLIVRLYDPQHHEWNVTFASATDGALGQPAIGGFTGGKGEFYGQERIDGRTVYVRSTLSNITPTSYRLEQALSSDGGRTWVTYWISDHTRLTP